LYPKIILTTDQW